MFVSLLSTGHRFPPFALTALRLQVAGIDLPYISAFSFRNFSV
jgi:hypothetical protein